jgi:hypothetical protein
VAIAFPLEEKPEPSPFDLTHKSDVDGSYSFTFSSEDASKTETRSRSGQVTGAYSYLDSNGKLQKYQYVADINGFQVFSTELPVGSTVPVKETPEVLEATAEHFALINKHLKKVAVARKAHEEYKRAHPDQFEEEFMVHHHETPAVIEYIPVVHHTRHLEHHVTEELPVPPMDDEDVAVAREEHLSEVARITAERLEALRTAPRWVEE